MTAPVPPVRHRWCAAVYDHMERLDGKRARQLRRRVAGRASGRVLEIGCGTGSNFAHYEWDGIEALHATEPDPYMLARAGGKLDALAAATRAKVTLHEVPAEALPFPDATFDCAVGTFVLCTVFDPERAIAELRRVLKPDGAYYFMEHIGAAGFALRAQRFLQPLWGHVAGGCHLDRATLTALANAGFVIEVEERMRPAPVMPIVLGSARPAP